VGVTSKEENMTQVAVALLVTVAKKDAVVAALDAISDNYTVGFIRKVAASDPPVTPQSTPTHWYNNDSGADLDMVVAWQLAIDGFPPETLPQGREYGVNGVPTMQQVIDALDGLELYTAQNVTDFITWAHANIGPERALVPDEEP
jgi:hypothetical protein